MFGLGERAKVEKVAEELATVDLAGMPDYARGVIEHGVSLLDEYRELVEGRKSGHLSRWQRKVYVQRQQAVERQIDHSRRVARILLAGYEPYTPNGDYYAGGIERKVDRVRFSAPIPVQALRKYADAKHSRLFDGFLVMSPHREHFDVEIPLSVRIDPVLVGYIRRDPEVQIGWRLQYDGRLSDNNYNGSRRALCFLVAAWGLKEDREG